MYPKTVSNLYCHYFFPPGNLSIVSCIICICHQRRTGLPPAHPLNGTYDETAEMLPVLPILGLKNTGEGGQPLPMRNHHPNKFKSEKFAEFGRTACCRRSCMLISCFCLCIYTTPLHTYQRSGKRQPYKVHRIIFTMTTLCHLHTRYSLKHTLRPISIVINDRQQNI